MSTWVGIDVSARKVDVVCLNEEASKHREFARSPSGLQALAQWLLTRSPSAVVMEATGVYYLDVAVTLNEAGLPVTVINPRAFHHFAQAHLEPSKTDLIDARLLAEYARRMPLKAWVAPPETYLQLRDIARRINQLSGLATAEKNRLHALNAKASSSRILVQDLESHIAELGRSIQRLTEAALELISTESKLQRGHELLCSATGIGQASGVALLGELCLLPEDLRSNQVSRHAGLDVRLAQSGSSLDRPGRLSKAGNAYLRAALHMPSLSFTRHDARARAHYLQLQERGKKKMQALCAIQRKILTGLWACLKSDQPFDSSKLFAIEPAEA